MIGLFSAIDKLNFGEALLILVLGMLIILAVLSILIGLLYIINAVIRRIEKPKKESAKVPANQNQINAAEPAEDDEEVIAAVTAAITCIMQEEQGETVIAPFKIKKIKHIH